MVQSQARLFWCFSLSCLPSVPPSFGLRGSPHPAVPLARHHELLPKPLLSPGEAKSQRRNPKNIPACVGARGWGANEETPVPAGPMALLPPAP